MTPSLLLRATANGGPPRDDTHDTSLETKSADGGPASPLDAEKMRAEILVRLMRLHCARLGGCTRRCRRVGRCVAADAVVAKVAAGRDASGRQGRRRSVRSTA